MPSFLASYTSLCSQPFAPHIQWPTVCCIGCHKDRCARPGVQKKTIVTFVFLFYGMSGTEPPSPLNETFEHFDNPPTPLQRAVCDAPRTVRVEDMLKPNTMYKLRCGDTRMEAITRRTQRASHSIHEQRGAYQIGYACAPETPPLKNTVVA